MTTCRSSRRSPEAAAPPAAEPAPGPFDLVPRHAVVAVAMSGGVDSSVAAARCAARGLRTFGITLAMWPRDRELQRDRGCCSADAVDDARRVASTVGIPHYAWDLESDFRARVIHRFEADYSAGRTPNPCVRCNQRIKFGTLLERARAAGATHVATGHYARLGMSDGRWTLHRAADPRKDQAFTLHRLDQRQLAAAIFPLGGAGSKEEIREEAARLGLGTAAKPDSQDLCFVDGPIRLDLERRLRGRYTPGPMVDESGVVVGEHRGLPFYTVGQRSGLGRLASRPDTPPLYVLDVDPDHNAVVVGERRGLLTPRVLAGDFRWVAGEAPHGPFRCEAQFRSHGGVHPVTARLGDSGAVVIDCHPEVPRVAPGQSVVLYRGHRVMGGGTVRRLPVEGGRDGGAGEAFDDAAPATLPPQR